MAALSRRTMLAGAAMAATMPTLGHAKGPLVWMDMDQKELDDAYTQGVYAPNLRQILSRCARNSELVRERIGAPKRLSYGPTPVQGMDVYAAKSSNAPVLVFIHGGAWRSEVARDYGYAAEMAVDAGAHFVVPDFNNVTDLGGDLLAMADQVRRSVAFAYQNARSFGGDPERFYIAGHSSGGHWIGVLVTTDWQKDFGIAPTFIKGAISGSGLYDLKPVRMSVRSSYIKFTDEVEDKLSAQRHLDKLVAPLALVYGSLETPEFQRQSRDFYAAVKAAGKPVTIAVMEGYNHFEVMESIGNPLSLFGRAALETMKLKPA